MLIILNAIFPVTWMKEVCSVSLSHLVVAMLLDNFFLYLLNILNAVNSVTNRGFPVLGPRIWNDISAQCDIC